jgi:hypothetical protein
MTTHAVSLPDHIRNEHVWDGTPVSVVMKLRWAHAEIRQVRAKGRRQEGR